jgi:hypothetical protein
MLAQLQNGHSHLTHRHLLCKESMFICKQCGAALNISYILVKCPHYDEYSLTFHLHGTLCNMFGDDYCSVSSILAFSNGIGLANTI